MALRLDTDHSNAYSVALKEASKLDRLYGEDAYGGTKYMAENLNTSSAQATPAPKAEENNARSAFDPSFNPFQAKLDAQTARAEEQRQLDAKAAAPKTTLGDLGSAIKAIPTNVGAGLFAATNEAARSVNGGLEGGLQIQTADVQRKTSEGYKQLLKRLQSGDTASTSDPTSPVYGLSADKAIKTLQKEIANLSVSSLENITEGAENIQRSIDYGDITDSIKIGGVDVGKKLSDWYDDVQLENANRGSAGQFITGLAQSAGHLLPDMAVGGAIGAAAGAAGLGEAAITSARAASGLGTMYSTVYQSTVENNLKNGMDATSAVNNANLKAVTEVATELIGGTPGLTGDGILDKGIARMADKLNDLNAANMAYKLSGMQVDNWATVLGNTGKFLASPAGDLVTEMIGEATEEGLASIVEPFIDRGTGADPNAKIEWDEVALSALGGAIMGGVFDMTGKFFAKTVEYGASIKHDGLTGKLTWKDAEGNVHDFKTNLKSAGAAVKNAAVGTTQKVGSAFSRFMGRKSGAAPSAATNAQFGAILNNFETSKRGENVGANVAAEQPQPQVGPSILEQMVASAARAAQASQTATDGRVSATTAPTVSTTADEADTIQALIYLINEGIWDGVSRKTLEDLGMPKGLDFSSIKLIPQFAVQPLQYVPGVTTLQDCFDYVNNTLIPTYNNYQHFSETQKDYRTVSNATPLSGTYTADDITMSYARQYAEAHPEIEAAKGLKAVRQAAADEINNLIATGESAKASELISASTAVTRRMIRSIQAGSFQADYGVDASSAAMLNNAFERAWGVSGKDNAKTMTEAFGYLTMRSESGVVDYVSLPRFVQITTGKSWGQLTETERTTVKTTFADALAAQHQQRNNAISALRRAVGKYGLSVKVASGDERAYLYNTPGDKKSGIKLVATNGDTLYVNPDVAIGTDGGFVAILLGHELAHTASLRGATTQLAQIARDIAELVGIDYNTYAQDVAKVYKVAPTNDSVIEETNARIIGYALSDNNILARLAEADADMVNGFKNFLLNDMIGEEQSALLRAKNRLVAYMSAALNGTLTEHTAAIAANTTTRHTPKSAPTTDEFYEAADNALNGMAAAAEEAVKSAETPAEAETTTEPEAEQPAAPEAAAAPEEKAAPKTSEKKPEPKAAVATEDMRRYATKATLENPVLIYLTEQYSGNNAGNKGASSVDLGIALGGDFAGIEMTILADESGSYAGFTRRKGAEEWTKVTADSANAKICIARTVAETMAANGINPPVAAAEAETAADAAPEPAVSAPSDDIIPPKAEAAPKAAAKPATAADVITPKATAEANAWRQVAEDIAPKAATEEKVESNAPKGNATDGIITESTETNEIPEGFTEDVNTDQSNSQATEKRLFEADLANETQYRTKETVMMKNIPDSLTGFGMRYNKTLGCIELVKPAGSKSLSEAVRNALHSPDIRAHAVRVPVLNDKGEVVLQPTGQWRINDPDQIKWVRFGGERLDLSNNTNIWEAKQPGAAPEARDALHKKREKEFQALMDELEGAPLPGVEGVMATKETFRVGNHAPQEYIVFSTAETDFSPAAKRLMRILQAKPFFPKQSQVVDDPDVLSLRLFGQPYDKLTSSQKKKVSGKLTADRSVAEADSGYGCSYFYYLPMDGNLELWKAIGSGNPDAFAFKGDKAYKWYAGIFGSENLEGTVVIDRDLGLSEVRVRSKAGRTSDELRALLGDTRYGGYGFRYDRLAKAYVAVGGLDLFHEIGGPKLSESDIIDSNAEATYEQAEKNRIDDLHWVPCKITSTDGKTVKPLAKYRFMAHDKENGVTLFRTKMKATPSASIPYEADQYTRWELAAYGGSGAQRFKPSGKRGKSVRDTEGFVAQGEMPTYVRNQTRAAEDARVAEASVEVEDGPSAEALKAIEADMADAHAQDDINLADIARADMSGGEQLESEAEYYRNLASYESVAEDVSAEDTANETINADRSGGDGRRPAVAEAMRQAGARRYNKYGSVPKDQHLVTAWFDIAPEAKNGYPLLEEAKVRRNYTEHCIEIYPKSFNAPNATLDKGDIERYKNMAANLGGVLWLHPTNGHWYIRIYGGMAGDPEGANFVRKMQTYLTGTNIDESNRFLERAVAAYSEKVSDRSYDVEQGPIKIMNLKDLGADDPTVRRMQAEKIAAAPRNADVIIPKAEIDQKEVAKKNKANKAAQTRKRTQQRKELEAVGAKKLAELSGSYNHEYTADERKAFIDRFAELELNGKSTSGIIKEYERAARASEYAAQCLGIVEDLVERGFVFDADELTNFQEKYINYTVRGIDDQAALALRNLISGARNGLPLEKLIRQFSTPTRVGTSEFDVWSYLAAFNIDRPSEAVSVAEVNTKLTESKDNKGNYLTADTANYFADSAGGKNKDGELVRYIIHTDADGKGVSANDKWGEGYYLETETASNASSGESAYIRITRPYDPAKTVLYNPDVKSTIEAMERVINRHPELNADTTKLSADFTAKWGKDPKVTKLMNDIAKNRNTWTPAQLADAMERLSFYRQTESTNNLLGDALKSYVSMATKDKALRTQLINEMVQELGYDGIVSGRKAMVFDLDQVRRTGNPTPSITEDFYGFVLTTEEYGEIMDETLGMFSVADEMLSGAFDDLWNSLEEEYGAYNAGTDYSVPKQSSGKEGYRVSEVAASQLERMWDQQIASDYTESQRRGILRGIYDHAVVPNAAAESSAHRWLENYRLGPNAQGQNVYDISKAYVDLMSLQENGKFANKQDEAKAFAFIELLHTIEKPSPTMIRMAENARIGMKSTVSNAAQIMQGWGAMLKSLTPYGRIAAINDALEDLKMKAKEQYGGKGGPFKKQYEGYIESLQNVVLSDENLERIANAQSSVEIWEAEEAIKNEIAAAIEPLPWARADAFRMLCMLGNPLTAIRNYSGNLTSLAMRKVRDRYSGAVQDLFMKEADTHTHSSRYRATEEHRAFAEMVYDNVVKVRSERQSKTSFASDIERRVNNFKGMGAVGTSLAKWQAITDELNNGEAIGDSFFMRKNFVDAFADYVAAQQGYDPTHWNWEALAQNTADQNQRFNAAVDYAYNQAQQATFHTYSEVASTLNRWEKSNIVTRFIFGGIFPFKKTTINIAKTMLNYSPVGLITGFDGAIRKVGTLVNEGKPNEHIYTMAEAIDGITAGMTGCSIALMGYALAATGLFKLNARPEDDDRKAKYEKMIGYQDYSVTVGNKNYTIDFLTPSSFMFLVGAALSETMREQTDGQGMSSAQLLNATIDALDNLVDPFTNLSFLSGFNDLLQSYSDDNKVVAMLNSAGRNYLTQYVPSIGGQIARTIDPVRRDSYKVSSASTTLGGKDTDIFVNKIKAKVPGLSSTIEPYVDLWGRTENNGSLGERLVNNFLNPSYVRTINSTEVDDRLGELFAQSKDSSIFPTSPQKYATIDSVKYTYTPAEYTTIQKRVGEISYAGLESAFDSDIFNTLDAEAQSAIISSIYSYARHVAVDEYAKTNGIDYDNSNKKEVEKVAAAEATGLSVGEYFAIKQMLKSFDKKADKEKALLTYGLNSSQRELVL